MNLNEIWRENITRFDPYPALVYEGKEYTNAECDRLSSQLAHTLRNLGVGKGDRVLVTMPNCPEVIIGFGGISKSGAAVVPVMPLLQAQEVRYILGDCRPKIVLTDSLLLPKVQEAARDLQNPPEIFTMDALREEMEKQPEDPPDVLVDGHDEAALLYTAGTTGRPKGVRLSHRNLCSNAKAAAKVAEVLALKSGRVGLGLLPLSHAFGFTIMNTSLLLGDKDVLLPKFDPVSTLEAIERYRVTHFAAVPAMFHALYHHPDANQYDTSSLIACISGSASLSKQLAGDFQRKFGCVILEGYGLSEAAPIVTATDPTKPFKPGSVGLPLEGIEVAVVDEGGNRLPPNEAGELIVSGPNVTRGYLDRPEETGQILQDGWLHTGDIARIDDDGYVFIVDRKKDEIIRGGFNIYPRDLEELLLTHPDIVEAGVVGTHSEKMGEEVVAYVVARQGSAVREEDLIGFCQDQLAKYKTPRFLKIVNHLPKNLIGKTDKKILRKWAEKIDVASQT
ncbi:MAG TPA: long-chain fatty acid--CoA ligase [Bacillales bacterium]|nr:long-chain fatty acid--CoA ligase [Bacillales bacterium]